MKTKDIHVGFDYAIRRFGDHCSRGRVVAIEVVERRISSRSGFGFHNATQKMVKVTYVTDDGAKELTTDYVVPAKVEMTWANHEAYLARKRTEETSVEDALSATEHRFQRLLGEEIRFARSAWPGRRVGDAVVSASFVDRILDRLEQDQAQAKAETYKKVTGASSVRVRHERRTTSGELLTEADAATL